MIETVYLYKVGRNLNRAYRLCEAFSVKNLVLIDCHAILKGALFKAKGRVKIEEASSFPDMPSVLALETNFKKPISEICFSSISALLLGGESNDLPSSKLKFCERAVIPTTGKISGLTVESALAIALHLSTTSSQEEKNL